MLRNADTKWPAGSAKLVALGDYHRLSVMMKMSYLGAIRQFEPEPVVMKEMPGKSVLHTVAWSGRDGTMYATFLHVYMQLQRSQPTYAKLRHALREGQTDEEIAAQYPSVAAVIEA